MRNEFVNTLLEAARKDSSIVLITGDLGYGVLNNFQNELPKQFINSGVAEQSMMGMAAGIASTGKRVFVYSIGNFPTLRCLEQIRNDVCLMNNSVVIVSVGAGYSYGSQGYTHHALEDIAIIRALPNMEVVVPADNLETRILTNYLIHSNKPSYLRLGKSGEGSIHKIKPLINYGKFIELCSGKDGTIIFIGSIGSIALIARQTLLLLGLEIAVVSAPFVSCIDINYLKSRVALGPIVTLEEHSFRGGFGSAILESLSLNNLIGNVKMVASYQENLSQIGSQEYLRRKNGLTVENIVSKFIS